MISFVISFCNEGKELFDTIDSIVAHQRHQNEFIVINDCSDDNYDYDSKFENEYNFVRYFKNTKRLGSSVSKSNGISLASNETVLVLDAHMRVYDEGFDVMLNDMSESNQSTIFCSENRILRKNSDNLTIDVGAAGTWGARLCNRALKEFEPAWNQKKRFETLPEQIPCVLGASYVMQKSWWNRIHGFTGLTDYGYEEQLMSVKTYMFGGDCRVIPGWFTGHLYRKKFPYKINTVAASGNLLSCYYQFLSDEGFQYYVNVFRRNYPEHYIFARNHFMKQAKCTTEIRRELAEQSVMSFKEYMGFNLDFNRIHDDPLKFVF